MLAKFSEMMGAERLLAHDSEEESNELSLEAALGASLDRTSPIRVKSAIRSPAQYWRRRSDAGS